MIFFASSIILGGFYKPIKKIVKRISRIIGLHASGRDIDIEQVLRCELAPIPTALFEDSDEMRHSKSKSELKKCLAKLVSIRLVPDSASVVQDSSSYEYHWKGNCNKNIKKL